MNQRSSLTRWMSWCAAPLLVVSFAIGATAAPPALTAHSFPLSDVRLLPGPFCDAQEIAANYLLSFEPDRLLANFRQEAGLSPKAPHYAGWESQGVSGHTAGHYLSACALAYAATGDPRFLDRVNYIVSELAECQQAQGDGYVAAIPHGKEVYTQVGAGEIRSEPFQLNGCWVPNYTLHKLLAGLRDAYQWCDNQQALQVSRALVDWLDKTLANLTDEQFQQILVTEHGGMNEVLADLYADTQDDRYLALSRRFHHQAILQPLAAGEDILPGKHANTQIPKLIGLARRYELSGDENDRRAAEFFWDRVVHHHSYVTGGHCNYEHFGQPDQLNDRLSTDTTETCNVYNMLKLTRLLFGWKPEADLGDFYERALLNHIRSTQHPDGRVIYNLSLKPGGNKQYLTADSFTCCGGTGMENHVKYGEAIYFHGDDQLWVNLFIASEVNWQQRHLTLRQETAWPDADSTRLTFTCQTPQQLTLYIRRPYWATTGWAVTVNGQPQQLDSQPSSFVGINRMWQSGDQVVVTFPMSLRTESMPDNANRIAVFYGPTLLAADLGPVDDPHADSPFFVPALVTDGKSVADWVEEGVDQPGTFHTQGVGRPRDIALVPFHRLHDRRYTVYLDVLTPEQWNQRETEILALQQRERELAAQTVDMLEIGEANSERDHHLQGERTGTGPHLGRTWRHAIDGGWFSFQLKVESDVPQQLLCTYWGSESGPRTFDILVDDTKIAQQTLLNDKPGEFFEVAYSIPPELIRGREAVTVKLLGHPGNFAGGLFGCRLIRTVAEAPIKVLIIGGQNNHDWKQSTPFMKQVLDQAGHFDTVVNNTPESGASQEAWDAWRPRFTDFGCVVLDYNGDMWPADVKQAFVDYIRGGGGAVVIHAANNSFTGWKEYEQMVGLLWRDPSYGYALYVDDNGQTVRELPGQGRGMGHGGQYEWVMTTLDREHPITAGLPLHWIHKKDELYHGQRGPAENIHILLTALSDPAPGRGGTGKQEPIVWWVPFGKGRVVTNVMGHVGSLEPMECAGFKLLLCRSVEWAATGHCTTAVPEDFPAVENVK